MSFSIPDVWEKNGKEKGSPLLANAIPRSNTKGLHCIKPIVWKFLGVEESLRLEAEGITEVLRAVICGQLRNAHDGPFWNEMTGDVRTALGHDTGHRARHRWIAPESLFDAGEHCGDSRVSFLVD